MDTKELVEIKSQVSNVQLSVSGLNIISQIEMDMATELLHNISQAEKFVLEKKEIMTRPLMKSLATIRDMLKPIELNLADAKKTVKAKMLAYTLEEQEKIEKEKERLMARVEKGTMRADTAVSKIEAVGDGPKSNIRTLKKVRIVDETIIPREWLIPDMPRITEAVLRKGENIPGVELYEEKQIVAK